MAPLASLAVLLAPSTLVLAQSSQIYLGAAVQRNYARDHAVVVRSLCEQCRPGMKISVGWAQALCRREACLMTPESLETLAELARRVERVDTKVCGSQSPVSNLHPRSRETADSEDCRPSP